MSEDKSQKARQAAGNTKRARSRAASLRAATELLAEANGDRSLVTLASIAERSALSVVTLLKHFGSKEALLDAAEVSGASIDAALLSDDELLAAALRLYRISSSEDVELVHAAVDRWASSSPLVVLDLLFNLTDSPFVDAESRTNYARRAEWIAIQSRDHARLARARVALGSALGERGYMVEAGTILEQVVADVEVQVQERANAAATIATLEALSESLPAVHLWMNRAIDLDLQDENPWGVYLRVTWAAELLDWLGDQASIPSILARLPSERVHPMHPWQRAVVARLSGRPGEARLAHIEDQTPHSSDEALSLAQCERMIGNLDSARRLLEIAATRLESERYGSRAHDFRYEILGRRIETERLATESSPPPEKLKMESLESVLAALSVVEVELRSGAVLDRNEADALDFRLIQLRGYTARVPERWYMALDD